MPQFYYKILCGHSNVFILPFLHNEVEDINYRASSNRSLGNTVPVLTSLIRVYFYTNYTFYSHNFYEDRGLSTTGLL